MMSLSSSDFVEQAISLMQVSLKHYSHCLREKLLRYKQLVVVIVLLLSPTLGAIYNSTVMPLRVLFAPSVQLSSLLVVLLAYQILIFLWARLQRDAIIDESVAAFMGSLPIRGAVLLLRDVGVLLLSSAPLYIPLAIAFGQHIATHTPSVGSWSILTFIIISSTCLQLMYLYRWWPGFTLVMAATLVFARVITYGRPVAGALAASVLLAYTIYCLYFRNGSMRCGAPYVEEGKRFPSASNSVAMAIVTLNYRSLCASRETGYRFTVIATVMLAAMAVAIVASRDDSASQIIVSGVISTLSAIMVFLFSMSYTTIFAARARYAGLMASLPLSRPQWAMLDIISVEALPFIFTLIPCVIWFWRLVPGWLVSLPILAVLNLGVVNYFIYWWQGRHAITLSLLAMIIWLLGIAAMAGFIGRF